MRNLYLEPEDRRRRLAIGSNRVADNSRMGLLIDMNVSPSGVKAFQDEDKS